MHARMCMHSQTSPALRGVAYPGYASTTFPSSGSCLLYVGGGTFTSAAALNFNSSPPLCPPPPTSPPTTSPRHARVNVFPCDRREGGGWVGGGALLITMQCRQPAVWTDTPFFSLPSRRPPSASVCFIRETRRITKTHVWPPFFDVSPTDALFFSL